MPIPSPTQAPIIAKQWPPNTPNTLLAVYKSWQRGVGAEDAGMSQLSETHFSSYGPGDYDAARKLLSGTC